ncbi:MAG: LD-carboxypeptidase [Candidatus Beckwithbacteria bacterium]|nr:LD-carboxypeptidase [Candidatus Beckwithbacteria bacterium]
MMIERSIPEKLHRGDTIRVIAPSWSLSITNKDVQQLAEKTLGNMGLTVTYGDHVHEHDLFRSSPIESRVADIHEAFLDPSVKGILTVIGGWNSNQLLQYLDWDLIKTHPKVFCGFSDIDALNNAIFSQTGLVTYSGPHFIFFGQKYHFDYTKEHFQKAVMDNQPFLLEQSSHWSDDKWSVNQEDRHLIKNQGLLVIHEGTAEGTVISSNLCTLNLLQGTEYFPKMDEAILFIEEAKFSNPSQFDRNLQSLVQQKGFKIRGLVLGRFQPNTMTEEQLVYILRSKRELKNIPIIANADFGHTDPKATIPIGGTVRILASAMETFIEFTEH